MNMQHAIIFCMEKVSCALELPRVGHSLGQGEGVGGCGSRWWLVDDGGKWYKEQSDSIVWLFGRLTGAPQKSL